MPDNEINFVPLWDYLLIEPDEVKTTKGGLALPDGTRLQDLNTGKVIKAGKGAYRESGAFIENPVKEGDTVYMLGRAVPFTVNLGGKKYLCMSGRDVVAIAGK